VRIVTSRMPCCLLFTLLSLHCAAQPADSPSSQAQDDLAKARESISAVEVAHPGNTLEADAVWHSARKLLLERRAAGKAPTPGIGRFRWFRRLGIMAT
jgi:hypothetical protein